jgi:hypothetical protein
VASALVKLDRPVTTHDQDSILAALHQMEVRFTDRLARIEAEAKAWRTQHNDLRAAIKQVDDSAKSAAQTLALTQAVDAKTVASALQRLTLGLVVVGIMAAGRVGMDVFRLVN